MHRQIIRTIKEAAGEDFILALRFGGCDYLPGGSQTKDIPAACALFEEAGIDLLDISGGLCGYSIQGRSEPGWFKECSLAAKKCIHVPLILTGGIQTKEDAECLLEEGACDLVGVGRKMMTDPKWAERAIGSER